ncbi:hypothetical protein DFJ77DRAFT_473188 [Powellomyces hirtus]|nr:hypothetical protein DFJ77DRAFT_473188 [Powellomyces hirtus]
MEADLDTTATFQPSQSTPSVSVRTLLGPAQNPLYQVYASHILQQIHAARNAEKRPLLLSIALKRSVGGDGQKDEEDGFALSEDDRKTFVEVMQLCRDVRVW